MRALVWSILPFIFCNENLTSALKLSKRDVTEGIPVCPSSRPYAIKQGSLCCKLPCSDFECQGAFFNPSAAGPCHSIFDAKTVSWAEDVCPRNISIPCPEEGNQCEDRFPSCTEKHVNVTIIVDGFGPDWDGEYSHNSGDGFDNYEGNREVFDRKDNCIWWNRKFRHWWLGFCQDIGDNSGWAFLSPDLDCPYRDTIGQWKDFNSSEVIQGASMNTSLTCDAPAKVSLIQDLGSFNIPIDDRDRTRSRPGAGGIPTDEATATAGIAVSTLRSSNRITRRCSWKKIHGRWRCVKE